MKKNFTLFLCLIIASIGATAQPAVQWQHFYGGAGNENLYGFNSKATSDGGAILCGSSTSSNTGTFTGLTNNGGLDALIIKLDASGNTTLQKLYGGSGDDELLSIRQTADGGYIAVGDALSSNSGTLTGITNNGGKDGLIMKLNASGTIIWQKLLGGSADDILYSARQTSDGGYILSGSSASSNSGTLTGITNNGGAIDGWIIKLDGSGNTVWQKLLGGSGFDRFLESAQTTDGGYIAVGTATGTDGTLTGVTSYGDLDGWIIKLDAAGNTTWQKLYGGGSADQFGTVEQTTDGGYILAYAAANVNSVNGTYTVAGYGQYDGWVVKTDGSGNLQWQKLLGTNLQDFFNGVQQTSDGGYILTGQASSGAPNQGSLTGLTFNGGYDGWIVKLNGGGDVQWQELLGGSLDDNLIAVQQTSDGGYFAAGYSSSSNTGTLSSLTNNGGVDGWSVKLAPYSTPKRPGSGNTLLFSNATQTSVDIGKGFDFTGSFSFEAWVKRSSLTDTDPNGEAFVSSGAFGGWGIGFNNNTNPIPHTIEFGKVGTSEVNSTSVVYDLKWHHIAVTYDTAAHQVKFYIDGLLDATVAYSPTDFNSGNSDYSIGALTSTTSNYLKGNIDEIRIWNNTVLTQTEVRNWMCKKVTSAHPAYANLLAYFHLDEGTGTATYSVDGRIGTLVNSPAWQTSGASVGDTSKYVYSATPSVTLAHPQGESFTAAATSGSPAGIQVYRVDSIPNDTTGARGIGANDRYFGVFVVGGSTPQYTATYHYNGNPYIADKNTLRLYKRDDNADVTWADAAAVNNTTSNTLTATGQHTEYILGSIAAPLPVTLSDFNAIKSGTAVLLTWKTENETDLKSYQVERSNNGTSFIAIANISATNMGTYTFTDASPLQGKNYYRLVISDINSNLKFSDIRSIDFNNHGSLTISPNPAHDLINISASSVIDELQIINLRGQIVKKWNKLSPGAYINIAGLENGTYTIRMVNENKIQTLKFVKQ